MGIFWLWRQIFQNGLLVAPRDRRHVLFSTSLGVCWGISGAFVKKIEQNMTNFLAPIKKSFFCLCQFRLFFLFLNFTGGNPWPNTVPANPFGMKSGIFFCLEIERVLGFHWDRSFIPAPKFSFLRLPSIKLSNFFDKTLHRRSEVLEVACCCGKSSIFLVFLLIFDEIFCALHFSIFQEKNEVLKN